jgi:hypothetical protein
MKCRESEGGSCTVKEGCGAGLFLSCPYKKNGEPSELVSARVAAQTKASPTIAAVITAAISAAISATAATASATTAAASTTTAAATAATAAATPAAVTTATTAVAAAAATAFGLRLGFVDDQIASAKILTIQAGDGLLCVFVGGDFDESEAARLSREAITDKRDSRRSDSNLREPFVELIFCGGKRKVTNVELLHLRAPSVWNRRASCGGALRSWGVERRAGEKRNAAGTSGSSAVRGMVSKKRRICNRK